MAREILYKAVETPTTILLQNKHLWVLNGPSS